LFLVEYENYYILFAMVAAGIELTLDGQEKLIGGSGQKIARYVWDDT
jgi:hypothetical protein